MISEKKKYIKALQREIQREALKVSERLHGKKQDSHKFSKIKR